MPIQLKSGQILLNGGQIANGSNCCCNNGCLCGGVPTIRVDVVDNFGYNDTSGTYFSPLTSTPSGCAWSIQFPQIFALGVPNTLQWTIQALVVSFGALPSAVRLTWLTGEAFPGLGLAGGNIGVLYNNFGTFRFQHPAGPLTRYIEITLVC